MTMRVSHTAQMSQSGVNLLRFVLASYFIGTALGLIEGTNVTALALQFLPDNLGLFVANTCVFLLAYFVLMGIWLRPAALLLSVYVLATSGYLTVTGLPTEVVNDFWRDAALVSGLMMTYLSTPGRHFRNAVVRSKPSVRKVDAKTPVRPRRIATLRKPASPVVEAAEAPTLMKPIREGADVVNIFAA